VRTARGVCEGRIGTAPRGANGFGYDPVFEPDLPAARAGRTFAELESAEKEHLSHRGRAVRALLPAIRELVLAGAAQDSAAKRS
jgi:XTP/dITP diphosphohydrolase